MKQGYRTVNAQPTPFVIILLKIYAKIGNKQLLLSSTAAFFRRWDNYSYIVVFISEKLAISPIQPAQRAVGLTQKQKYVNESYSAFGRQNRPSVIVTNH